MAQEVCYCLKNGIFLLTCCVLCPVQVQWEILIVDEGHRLKNAESKLADILRSYSFGARVLLTGTPIQNSLTELWALLNFVLPQIFNSAEAFDEWFAAPFRVILLSPCLETLSAGSI